MTVSAAPPHRPAESRSGEIVERDHGGDLAAARTRFGGLAEQWLDLSTGINPDAYPLPALPEPCWTRLPQPDRMVALQTAARDAYGHDGPIAAAAGAQAIIQWVPALAGQPGRCAIVAPTYNEHAASFRAAGWTVDEIPDPAAAGAADVLVLVNPNNPDGRTWTPDVICGAAEGRRLVVIDESFADAVVGWTSAAALERPNILVLRSFGKFFGLAGVRLGFALGPDRLIAGLVGRLGPWAVSGPALEIGIAALADRDWRTGTCARLAVAADRLDRLAAAAGLAAIGGTPLFRLYSVASAHRFRDHMARRHIWVRIFPYSDTWVRIGLPGFGSSSEPAWDRVSAAFRAWGDVAV